MTDRTHRAAASNRADAEGSARGSSLENDGASLDDRGAAVDSNLDDHDSSLDRGPTMDSNLDDHGSRLDRGPTMDSNLDDHGSRLDDRGAALDSNLDDDGSTLDNRGRGSAAANRGELSAVLIVGVALSGLGYLLGGLGSYLVLLARDVGVGRGELTWLSVGFGAALLAVGAAGPWVLRVGAHRALRAAAASLAAGMALLAVAPGVAAAQVGGLLAGAGGAVLVLASSALLAGPGLGARLTRVNAASSAAGITAPLLLGTIDTMAGSGRLAFLLPAPALLWVAASSPPVAPPLAGGRPSLARVASAWMAIVLAVSAEFAFVVWGAARLVDGGLDPSSAAAAAAAFPIGMAGGRLAAPRFFVGASLLVPGALVGAAGAALVIAPTGPALATGGLALAGLGIAVLYPLTLAGLVGTPGLGAGLGAALGCAASGAAALAAPAMLGGLAAWTGLRPAFTAVPVLLLLLIALERSRSSD